MIARKKRNATEKLEFLVQESCLRIRYWEFWRFLPFLEIRDTSFVRVLSHAFAAHIARAKSVGTTEVNTKGGARVEDEALAVATAA